MRIIFIGLFLMLVFSPGGFSQDLVLKYGESVVNGDSIYLSGTKSSELIEVRLSVTNNRTTSVTLKLRKTELYVVEGTECSFCWGECYTPAVMVSPMQITILPGATDRISFIGEYRPYEIEGTSIVKYTFFDPADTTFQQSVTVFYQIGGSGIHPDQLSEKIISVGPNPAHESIRLFLPDGLIGTHKASLMNGCGQEVLELNLPAGQQVISLPVAGIHSGFYYLKIMDKTRVLSVQKICINH